MALESVVVFASVADSDLFAAVVEGVATEAAVVEVPVVAGAEGAVCR